MTLNNTTINEVSEILSEIRDELKELRLLYKELVEKIIPVEEPQRQTSKELLKRRINS